MDEFGIGLCTALSSGCPHLLMGSSRATVLRYRPVRETPIMSSCAAKPSPRMSPRARLSRPGKVPRDDTAGCPRRRVELCGGHHQDEVLIVLGTRTQPREQPISHLPPPRGLPR